MGYILWGRVLDGAMQSEHFRNLHRGSLASLLCAMPYMCSMQLCLAGHSMGRVC